MTTCDHCGQIIHGWKAEDYGLPAGTPLPPITNFTSPPGTCKLLVGACRQFKPDLILEFGAGISTVVLSTWLPSFDPVPAFFSVENDQMAADEIRPLAPRAVIVVAPVVTDWYDWVPIRQALLPYRGAPRRIVAFVDGPSTALSGPRGRGRALGLIDHLFRDPDARLGASQRPCMGLSDERGWSGAILLDDVQRLGENEDFIEWTRRYPDARALQIPVEHEPSDPLYVQLKRIGVLVKEPEPR